MADLNDKLSDEAQNLPPSLAAGGSLQTAMNEIENAMERWHHARDEDKETLQKINDILVSIGRLGWFNKK